MKMNRRQLLGKLVDDKLLYGDDTTKLRWILDANNWTNGTDVMLGATDEQVEAFHDVWGLDAYSL
jgi:hypothetical protein